LPLHPATSGLIHDYLDAAGHGDDETGALFRPIRNNRTGRLDQAVTPDGVYKLVRTYAAALGLDIRCARAAHDRKRFLNNALACEKFSRRDSTLISNYHQTDRFMAYPLLNFVCYEKRVEKTGG
jgi:hypothetical protein